MKKILASLVMAAFTFAAVSVAAPQEKKGEKKEEKKEEKKGKKGEKKEEKK